MDREVRFETSYLGRLSAGSVRSHARAPRRWSPMRFFPICFLALPFLLVGGGCKRSAPTSLVAHGDTFAEMRTIKGEIGVNAPGESKRAPYPRERLAEGSEVLRGAARAGTSADRATAGERLTLGNDGSAKRTPAVAWDDWTGGLATADPVAQPAPFGLGTVGARPPGDKGKPRFSLVIERLDVRVSVDHDFAITEVDQTFVNPSSDTVEGLFSFRTPVGSVLHKFGVDRDGELVWGKVKESAAAHKQYESNVYQGSTEDPALLAWVAPGVYNARLYPIQAGAKRRVVTRYAEWLSRQGPKADRRLYVYPMAAEGARGSLPRIEEMRVSISISSARVRAASARA